MVRVLKQEKKEKIMKTKIFTHSKTLFALALLMTALNSRAMEKDHPEMRRLMMPKQQLQQPAFIGPKQRLLEPAQQPGYGLTPKQPTAGYGESAGQRTINISREEWEKYQREYNK